MVGAQLLILSLKGGILRLNLELVPFICFIPIVDANYKIEK